MRTPLGMEPPALCKMGEKLVLAAPAHTGLPVGAADEGGTCVRTTIRPSSRKSAFS